MLWFLLYLWGTSEYKTAKTSNSNTSIMDFDLVILGSGPAGFSCAIQATKYKKKILIVEANDHFLGGGWINAGTVPSKALREVAYSVFKHRQQFGDDASDTQTDIQMLTMNELMRFKTKVQENETRLLKQDLKKNNIKTISGFGRLLDDHTVEVNDPKGDKKRFSAEKIFLATGSHALPPTTFEIDQEKIFDVDSLTKMNHMPRRLVIVGAGVNAIEFATMFSAMGTMVTILNENDKYLPFLDRQIWTEFDRFLQDHGIVLYHNSQIESVEFNPLRNFTEVRFNTNDVDHLKVIETDHVLYLGGRQPNTNNLGLIYCGINVNDRGFIDVNDYYQTNITSVYAAGDVIGFPALASASFTQGRLAAQHMFGKKAETAPAHIPFGIYSIPEISSIGITEEEAKNQGRNFEIGHCYFNELTRADIGNTTYGLLKLVYEADTHQLLGVHIMGENACELIHIGQAVMALKGTIDYFTSQILNYPTYTEAYRIAATRERNRNTKR